MLRKRCFPGGLSSRKTQSLTILSTVSREHSLRPCFCQGQLLRLDFIRCCMWFKRLMLCGDQ